MPRTALIHRSKLHDALRSYANRISDNENRIRPPSDPVWKDISEEIDFVYRPKYIYVYVKQNRNNIWKDANLSECANKEPTSECEENKETTDPEKQISSEDSYSEKTDTESSNSNDDAENSIHFILTLSHEEWNEIKPNSSTFSDDKNRRNYRVLAPRLWTSLVSEHFWDVTSLPCCLSFKRAHVSSNEEPFVRMIAKCVDCNSKFLGEIKHEPLEESRAVIKCRYEGSFLTCKSTSKRRLIGKSKEYANFQIGEKNLSAVTFRNFEARRMMHPGDAEPPIIPTANALRILKHRNAARNNQEENPIVSLNIIMHDTKYQNSIRHLGYDPFFVIYLVPSQ